MIDATPGAVPEPPSTAIPTFLCRRRIEITFRLREEVVVPKKSSRGKGKTRGSVPKKLILKVVFEPQQQSKKPPFFRGSWDAKAITPKRRK